MIWAVPTEDTQIVVCENVPGTKIAVLVNLSLSMLLLSLDGDGDGALRYRCFCCRRHSPSIAMITYLLLVQKWLRACRFTGFCWPHFEASY